MKLYRTTQGAYVEENGSYFLVPASGWDELICSANLDDRVRAAGGRLLAVSMSPRFSHRQGIKEVWAAGVTYYRSRNARMEESKDTGGGDFYDRVYAAEPPELFFKATGWRVVGPGAAVHIRSDAKWSGPEPELTLLINPAGNIVGCTIGNDIELTRYRRRESAVSCRSSRPILNWR